MARVEALALGLVTDGLEYDETERSFLEISFQAA